MNESDQTPLRQKVSLKDLEPLLLETLERGGCVKLPVTGTSNLPTLAPERDQVTLQKPMLPLKKGDLPLYKRDNGQYVLHRIVSVQEDGRYVCCGDHQWKKEKGIRPDQILGLTTVIFRKGREFSVENGRYRRWVRLWVFLLPCRRFFVRLYHIFCHLKRVFPEKRALPSEK